MSQSTTLKPPAATIDAACALLEQCDGFLASLEQQTFTTPSERMLGSTIGQHVRHSLDHYSAALASLDGAVVDYDTRQRDTPVENDLEAARSVLAEIRQTVAGLGEDALVGGLTIRVMLNAEGDGTELPSTLGRELAFATHHAIHHCAMIASIAGEHGATVPAGFGKAPSTSNHERAMRG